MTANRPVLPIAAHGDPAQAVIPFDRDTLTPRRHPLRSATDLRRDHRVIGDRVRDYWRRKSA